MKFKDDIDTVFTGEPYYDLFDGGYIDPEDMLEDPEDVRKVKAAVRLVDEFLFQAQEAGAIGQC